MGPTRETILVIEDDADVRDFLGLLLGSEGYAVELADSGQAALCALHAMKGRRELPVLILLDLEMPQMTGPQFRAVQLDDPDLREVPVLVLSGDAEGEEQAAQLGAAYLRKPASLERLLSAVRRHKRAAAGRCAAEDA